MIQDLDTVICDSILTIYLFFLRIIWKTKIPKLLIERSVIPKSKTPLAKVIFRMAPIAVPSGFTVGAGNK